MKYKKHQYIFGVVIACILFTLITMYTGFEEISVVYNYARKDLEHLEEQGQIGPRFFASCTMVSSYPFVEVENQEMLDKCFCSGTVICSMYGFPKDSKVKGVALRIYVDSQLQSIQEVNWGVDLSGRIIVVEAPFRVPVSREARLSCVIEATTEDGLCYYHTALEVYEDELHVNTRTEVLEEH